MNRKIMKLMAACIITVIFLRNGMADICYAMNKTEIGRDECRQYCGRPAEASAD